MENLHERSPVALRQIHDGIHATGGIEKLLIHSCENAHTDHLKKKPRIETFTVEETS